MEASSFCCQRSIEVISDEAGSANHDTQTSIQFESNVEEARPKSVHKDTSRPKESKGAGEIAMEKEAADINAKKGQMDAGSNWVSGKSTSANADPSPSFMEEDSVVDALGDSSRNANTYPSVEVGSGVDSMETASAEHGEVTKLLIVQVLINPTLVRESSMEILV